MKKQIVVRKRKNHRIGIWVFYVAFIIVLLGYVIFIADLAELEPGVSITYFTVPVIMLMPLPLHYVSWQITLNANGIYKRLFWITMGSHSWTQVMEVRTTFSYTEQEVISILFKDGKTLRFRMICENADKARKMILTHSSIIYK